MESKHKNALIGALLAVVFVMAVGYAAFAQQLTINGTAEITSNWDVHFDIANDAQKTPVCSSPFNNNTTQCSSEGQYTAAHPTGGAAAQALVLPYGKIVYDNTPQAPLVANIKVELVQPGDSVTFTLKPKNFGTGLYATGQMTVREYVANVFDGGNETPTNTDEVWSIGDATGYTTHSISNTNATTSAVTVQKGYIRFTITPQFDEHLAPGSSDTITVVAEYVNPGQNARDTKPTSAGITVLANYVQTSAS